MSNKGNERFNKVSLDKNKKYGTQESLKTPITLQSCGLTTLRNICIKIPYQK